MQISLPSARAPTPHAATASLEHARTWRRFFRFIFGADLAGPPRRTFEDVLAAVSSNRDDAERRPAIIVVERATRELPPSEAE